MHTHTSKPFGQLLLSAITLLAMVLGMMSFTSLQLASAAPTADQTLTGSAVDGNLRITVKDSGSMGVWRYASGTWQRQIYNEFAKGSRLYYNGSAYSLAREATWVMNGTLPTLVSNSTSGNTITTVWNAGSHFQITQKTTYNDGNSYYRLEWNITNVSGAAINDLRFFHGEDTYLSGGDNGAGWWDAVNTTVGVQKDVSGVLQRMYLQGITTPFAYDSIYYSIAESHANAGALTNTVDPNVDTDNGYALEWRNASLAAGDTWTIVAFERFTSGTSGSVYVIAPVSTDCNVGTSCDVTYQVSNPSGTAVQVNLSVSSDRPTWNPTITSHTNPATVPANGAISVVVQVSPPAGTADGAIGNFTLTATPTAGGSAASDTAAVRAVATALDTDGDGIPDDTDIDDDNDGIPDSVEIANAPANGDTDGDGIPDHLDLDSDNDSINDVHEAGGTDADGDGMHDGAQGELTTPPDTDGDGQPDYVDLDSDNDSVSDLVESGSGATDLDNDGVADGPDADGDGIVDSADDNDALFGENNDAGPQDSDNDGDPDYLDLDSDGDGTDDIDEAGNGNLDADNDGDIDDPTDADNDGIADVIDDDDANFGGLADRDTDGDGIPDAQDVDDDNDGIPDSVEIANAPASGDTDGDGTPDHRDLDSDNDGINDVHEAGGTDADGDGMHDGAQGALTTPPDTDGDGQPDYVDLDSDNDAISDLVEGGSGATDADNDGVADGPDADGDGIVDSADDNDALFGEDNDAGPQDTDTDGNPDYLDLDSDGDGTDDIDEPGGNSGLDGNNDGRIDDATDNDNDGIADIIDEDDDNFGGLGDIDTDGDGIPNAQDIDDDNDGIPDSVEIANAPANGGDTDGDGIPDHLDLDSDNDGINDVHEAGGTDADGDGMHDGTQGELTTPPDTDGDGQEDYIDLDSDNDSISDLVEGGSGAIDRNHDGVADGPDADGDGIVDSADDNDALFGEDNDAGPQDTDNDGDPDYVDPDSDGDGTDDIDEAGNGDLDADNDGDIDDPTDADDDGIADVIDDDDNNFGGLGTDTTAPAPVTVTAPISGTVTNDNTPTFVGTGEPGADITIYDEEGNVVCTTTVNPDGSWSCTPTVPLAEGEQTFEVTQTDAAGNESSPVEVTVTIDTVAPAPVTITAPISGTATNDNTPTFAGTGEPGSQIKVYDAGGNVICTTTVAGDGSWSCTPSTPLAEGEQTFEVTQTDAAGNESSPVEV
ncbi:MAG: Ig-like domain-containing protein, partial [Anaerolineae bacterium]